MFSHIMVSLLVVSLLDCFLGTVSASKYYVTNETTSWEEANCTLATPDLEYAQYGITVKEDLDYDGEELWIGYYTAFQAFQYYGCSQFDSNTIRATNGLGHCFSACAGTDYVGIASIGIYSYKTSVKCVCLTSKQIRSHNLLQPNCQSTCDNYIACGDGSVDYYSVYKVLSARNIKKEQKKMNRCLYMVADVAGALAWGNCSKEYLPICEHDIFSEIDTEYFSGKKNRWWEAANDCLRREWYPVRPERAKILQLNKSSSHVWTGVLRSKTVFREKHLIKGDALFAVISRQDGVWNVSFSNSKYRALCEEPTETIHLTPVKPGPSGSGVTVGVFVPLLVIVFVAVILYKRRSLSKLCNRNVMNVDTGAETISGTVREMCGFDERARAANQLDSIGINEVTNSQYEECRRNRGSSCEVDSHIYNDLVHNETSNECREEEAAYLNVIS